MTDKTDSPKYYLMPEGERSMNCEHGWWVYVGDSLMFAGEDKIGPRHGAQFKRGQGSTRDVIDASLIDIYPRFICTEHLGMMPRSYKAYEGHDMTVAKTWREILCKVS